MEPLALCAVVPLAALVGWMVRRRPEVAAPGRVTCDLGRMLGAPGEAVVLELLVAVAADTGKSIRTDLVSGR